MKDTEPQGFLASRIFDDGGKQFVYTTNLPDPANRGPGGKGGGRPVNVAGQLSGSNQRLSGSVTAGSFNSRPGGHAGSPIQSRDDMRVSALEKDLEKPGFCREGYK